MLMDLAQLTAWIREYARVIGENAQHLTDLDAAIGDADHGINMERGMSAVLGALDEAAPADMSALCKQVGMTLVKSVGGASGPLYGTFFLRMAGALGTGESVGAADFAKALRAGVEGVVQRGRAEAGDKTMFDALAPALDALDAALASGEDVSAALADATLAVETGRDATESMVARKGRASYLGQRSVGHIDPGATSAAMLIAAAASAFVTGGGGGDRPKTTTSEDRSEERARTGATRSRGMSVGLVVVSHSRALARAAVALAQEMLHGKQIRIAIAAGLDDTAFGTDAAQIVDAITAADQGAGVVVLMDLGSAVLSSELALELLDDDVRERVVLCPAPLVEGLVVAAVAAASGASSDEVAAEAAGALAGKIGHLGTAPVAMVADAAADPDELTGTFVVTNPHGLHARPAARLVQEVRRRDAHARIRNRSTESEWVDAGSLSKIATLGVRSGNEVEVRVSGTQAAETLDHVLSLAARNFDESTTDTAATAPAPSAHQTLGAGSGL